MNPTVRPARKEDAETVARYALELFRQHHIWDRKRFADVSNLEGATQFYRSRVDANDAGLLIAEIDGRPVGFAYVQFEELNYADLLESAAWLHDIYVDQQARRSGAGAELIRAAKEAAVALGANKLVLSVAAVNTVGQAFFEQEGFRTTMHEMMVEVGPDV